MDHHAKPSYAYFNEMFYLGNGYCLLRLGHPSSTTPSLLIYYQWSTLASQTGCCSMST